MRHFLKTNTRLHTCTCAWVRTRCAQLGKNPSQSQAQRLWPLILKRMRLCFTFPIPVVGYAKRAERPERQRTGTTSSGTHAAPERYARIFKTILPAGSRDGEVPTALLVIAAALFARPPPAAVVYAARRAPGLSRRDDERPVLLLRLLELRLDSLPALAALASAICCRIGSAAFRLLARSARRTLSQRFCNHWSARRLASRDTVSARSSAPTLHDARQV